jgi:hypothetical protein
MIQAKFSYTAYPVISARLDISSLLDVSERMEFLAYRVHPGRAPVVSLTSFMSFWDRFRRKSKDEEHGEDEGQKKKRRGWGVFHGGGGTGNSNSNSSSTGAIHHRHHGGIGGTGRGHGGSISG